MAEVQQETKAEVPQEDVGYEMPMDNQTPPDDDNEGDNYSDDLHEVP